MRFPRLNFRRRFQTLPPSRPNAKHLIQFGWDIPGTGFFRADPPAGSPFAGCVFQIFAEGENQTYKNFTWNAWGKRAYESSQLEEAFGDLRAGRSNPLLPGSFLRMNASPGDLDWFDDFGSVLGNFRLAALLTAAGGARGIFLDVEEYAGRVFTYASQTLAAERSWADYARQAEQRGFEIMSAIQSGNPGAKLALSFGPSLAWKLSKEGKLAAREISYGLLVPFVDGLVRAADREGQLIDGYELSYGYRTPVQYWEGYERMRQARESLLSDPAKAASVMSFGFGVWLDFDKRWSHAWHWRNHFSPAKLERSLRAAMEQSDWLVWIYSEAVHFWPGEHGIKPIPPAYLAAIRSAAGAYKSEA